jgi:alpha-ketoglutarate-dependent 2,4-dichlorophenoxyacetate dioxygenase
MALTIERLHPVLAAQVTGLDLREPQTDAMIEAVAQAINAHAVLVFPGQHITDAQQMAFSARFGTLETTVKIYRKDYTPRLDPHVSDISNLDASGRIRAADDRLRLNGLGNRLWHSDSSFKAVPARFSLLSARVIPSEGGETEFADMRAAWDTLPAATQARLDGLVCEHTQLFSRARIGFTDWAEEERAKMAPVPQPLVRTHPGSGRKSLFLSSHAGRIRGMADPEAIMLLMDLTEHATQRGNVYAHRWRAGDLVMWDNRATMHRARPYDEAQVRDLHRTTVSDAA